VTEEDEVCNARTATKKFDPKDARSRRGKGKGDSSGRRLGRGRSEGLSVMGNVGRGISVLRKLDILIRKLVENY